MLKKLILTLSLSTVALIGAHAQGREYYVNGDRYWVNTTTEQIGGGRYRHILRAELYDTSEPNVYLSNIECNGDGDGRLSVTTESGDGVYWIDYSSEADWTWDASS
jgi:hypothetical protein